MSSTQIPLDPATVEALCRDLDLAEVGAAFEGGTFAVVHAATARDGRAAVLKVGPPDDVPLLTYESDLIAAEFDFYARTASVLPVPEALAQTVAGGRPAFAMTLVPGESLVSIELPDAERAQVRRQLGRLVGSMQAVTGTRFGYQRSHDLLSADTWRGAFELMWRALLTDAATWNVDLPAAEILGLCERAAPLLDAVQTPVLVHFDLWDGNVLITRGPSGATIEGLIDGERAFWGDPLAELVSTSLFADPAADLPFLEGYAETAAEPLSFTPDVRARLALYQAYLSAIMLVEAVPRGRSDDREGEAFLRNALLAQITAADAALGDRGL
jgi:aminoglycoside phosphotransferase (APT) family kinase protein